MPGIVLQTNAVKVVNKGGGFPTKMFREEVQTGINRKHTFTRRMVSTIKNPGTDYVVFVCPAPDCGSRNRKSVYEAKGQTKDGRLSFKCHKCYREVEVQKPMDHILSAQRTLEAVKKSPTFRPGTILSPDGRPIGE